MSNSHQFVTLPIGALFFFDPLNEWENPSIKVDDNHARTPSGSVIEVKGETQIYSTNVTVRLAWG